MLHRSPKSLVLFLPLGLAVAVGCNASLTNADPGELAPVFDDDAATPDAGGPLGDGDAGKTTAPPFGSPLCHVTKATCFPDDTTPPPGAAPRGGFLCAGDPDAGDAAVGACRVTGASQATPAVQCQAGGTGGDGADCKSGADCGAGFTCDTETGASEVLEVTGMFLAIGHVPNSRPFAGLLELDDQGYIKVARGGTSYTSVEGVFVCGDVADKVYRQAITAAGTGSAALGALVMACFWAGTLPIMISLGVGLQSLAGRMGRLGRAVPLIVSLAMVAVGLFSVVNRAGADFGDTFRVLGSSGQGAGVPDASNPPHCPLCDSTGSK